MAKFMSAETKRRVNETMASLLCPLKHHCDEDTKNCIELTLLVLQGTEVEDERSGED